MFNRTYLDGIKLGRPIVHFEIPANDTERMSKFYGELFDWKFDKQNMPGMDYWMIETTGTGPEHLGGGMYPKQHENDRPRFYVNVDDIDMHTDRFKNAGGTITIEKQEIPGFGWSVMGLDPEGNLVGLFQPAQPMRPARSSSTSSRRKSSGSKAKKSSSKSKKKSRR